MRMRFAASVALLVFATAMPAGAQSVSAPYDPSPAPLAPSDFDYGDTDLVIELGIGGAIQPEYLGSDDYMASLYGIASVEYVNIPGIGSFGGPNGLGFSVGPSFNYVGERDSNDLNGIDGVDATYEVGLKAGYEWQNAEVYGALRYGLGGAEGLVGDLGANVIVRPTERIVLKAGPTATFADSDYNNAYFSVSPREALASNGRFGTYNSGGGFNSVGVAAEARYEIFTDYFVTAEGSWDRLVGDAGDSPIVERAGDEDQYYFGLGVSKRFSLDLF